MREECNRNYYSITKGIHSDDFGVRPNTIQEWKLKRFMRECMYVYAYLSNLCTYILYSYTVQKR